MKKIVLMLIFFASCFTFHVNAQVYSPELIGHYGTRIIYYPDGYYLGNVENGVAHGLGTYYYSNGSFFQGNFYNGWWEGEGVIVTPYNGYLVGCWSGGEYMGDCPTDNFYNYDYDNYDYDNYDYDNYDYDNYDYDNYDNRVENLISDVQDERPDDNRYTAISPEGYIIKRIDPDTQMGRTLLGSYSGN